MPSYSAIENDGIALIAVQRAEGSEGIVGVICETSDGTAMAGSDYITTMDPLVWGDGDTSIKTCSIPIIEDDEVEPDETVTVELTNATGGATIGEPGVAILTIIEDDIFADGFESGDTSAWSTTETGPPPAGESGLHVSYGTLAQCGPVQLAPIAENGGSIRIKLPSNDSSHFSLSRGGVVVLDRTAPARAGQAIEITGLALASYTFQLTSADRSSIQLSIEMTAIEPCVAIDLNSWSKAAQPSTK